MKFEELKKSLNNQVLPFYIIKGKDAYLRSKAQEMIENKCVNSLKDINITRYNDENFNLESVLTDLSAMPMMADYRVIVLKDLNIKSATDTNAILKALQTKNQCNVLIISDSLESNWYKSLVSLATIIECDGLDELMLQKIALKTFQDNQVKIDAASLKMIVQFCNGDLSRINNEVNKLCNFVGEGGTVTPKIVNETVHKDLEYNIFELSNAVAKKDGELALSIVQQLLMQKESAQVLLMMILSNFRRMFFFIISKDTTLALSKKLGVKEFAVRKAKDMARSFTPVRLKSILDFGADLDYKIKSGNITAENAIYFFITNITI